MGVALAGMVVVAALAGLFVLGWVPREKRLAELHEQTAGGGAADDRPNVEVTRPKRSASVIDSPVSAASSRASRSVCGFLMLKGT